MMTDTYAQDILDQARKLIKQGWGTNLAPGSVTRKRDLRAGIVDDAVWNAIRFLQAEQGWVKTAPQPIAPSERWE